MHPYLVSLLLAAAATLAAAPIHPLPPAGVPVPPADRAELTASLERLRAATQKLRAKPLISDILVFEQAVARALNYDGFYDKGQIAQAKELLRVAEARAAELATGHAAWDSATGLIARGYVSRLDGSVQPYGLVVPPSYSPTAPHRWRVDIWFHGRGETLSEVKFLADRMRVPGEFTPRDTIVLHLYGRYCNAFRLAGEVDVFEALDEVRKHYPVDEDRILVRGFSMGGAAVWHIAAHHAGEWAAAAPGAGFADTAEYLKMTPAELSETPAWQRALWSLYDPIDYAENLFNCPIVAYNGELDKQGQAADMMERAMAAGGMQLKRVIGPGTEHKYHPASKIEIDGILDPIAARGRDAYPRQIRFTTFTLAYNRMKWVEVDALDQHWHRAVINASITGDASLEVRTMNVAAFTLRMGPGGAPFTAAAKPAVTIDGQKLVTPAPLSDRSWVAHFRRQEKTWTLVETDAPAGLAKRHGLQGPIDDAFLDSFIFVRPTGTPLAPAVAKWCESELAHAIERWRAIFRGEARVKDDRDITGADIASSNLVLWGDPGSNALLKRIADRLPVAWTAAGVEFNGVKHPATHVPVLVYPNPLNPRRYVVLNSGVTMREDANSSNARQFPRLPDWAILDTTTPPDEHYAGRIAAAGFFNESWGLK